MNTLPQKARQELGKILGLLEINLEGERDAAVRAATRLLEKHGVKPATPPDGEGSMMNGLYAITRNVGIAGIAVTVLSRMRPLRQDFVHELAQSMRDGRQLQPIVIRPKEGTGYFLVAGRHRLEAAKQLKWESISATIVEGMDADQALLAEIDENLVRAELSPAETSMHHAKRKELYLKLHPETRSTKQGGPGRGKQTRSQNATESAPAFIDDTAAKTGKHRATIARSVARADHIPRIADVVGTSLDQVEELAALARMPIAAQATIIDKAKNGEKVSAKPAAKRAKRAAREQSGGQAQANENADRTLNNRTFGAIYIDPPWRFETFSDAGKDRSADNHYETLSIAEIRERKPPVAKNCVVFMWTTGPMLAEAIQLLKDWGLTYKSRFVWRKPTAGTSFWQRDNAEELLVATIGNVVAPAPGTQSLAVIDAPTEKHSRKPAVFAEMIERLFPNTPKLEMYARPPFRADWTVWGNEVPGGMMEVTNEKRVAP